jgi:mannitol/fructose-specific phosphotransferase system IIA component (Ntr-type)
MRLSRYLRRGFVQFHLDFVPPPIEETTYEPERYIRWVKEQVIAELADLLDATRNVGNRSKLFIDLWNREKKASTAVGRGVAMPHVRSKQVSEPVLGFVRSEHAIEFDAPDAEPVRYFVVIVGPAFDPRLYLEIYRELASVFTSDGIREALDSAQSVGEIYRIFDGVY